MTQINPWLSFNGNCKAAMLFYQECLGGDLTLQTIAQTTAAAIYPSHMQDYILYSMLVKTDWVLMGSDITGPVTENPSGNITLALHSDSSREMRRLYLKLASGGVIVEPLSARQWGSLFAAVTDKFGKQWILNCNEAG